MLTDAEYGHILRNRSALEGRIRVKELEEDEHAQAKIVAHAEVEVLKGEMLLYTNFLKDAIKEYEKAHPPIEIPPG